MPENGNRVLIVPRSGHGIDAAENPYVTYVCARLAGNVAVLANGSHADPTAEKICMGMPVRDAITLSLLALDFEKDEYSTPRIIAVAKLESRSGWLGSIRRDGIDVRSFALEPGRIVHVSTYVHEVPDALRVSSFTAGCAAEACEFLFTGGVFTSFSHPVTAVAAVAAEDGFEVAVRNGCGKNTVRAS
jgi:IMP cyclohydrolase